MFHIDGIIWYVAFGVWLFHSYNISRFSYVVAILVHHSFLWFHTIPLYGCNTLCSSVYQLMDIWVASVSWLLWTMLLWRLTFCHLFEYRLSVLLSHGCLFPDYRSNLCTSLLIVMPPSSLTALKLECSRPLWLFSNLSSTRKPHGLFKMRSIVHWF